MTCFPTKHLSKLHKYKVLLQRSVRKNTIHFRVVWFMIWFHGNLTNSLCLYHTLFCVLDIHHVIWSFKQGPVPGAIITLFYRRGNQDVADTSRLVKITLLGSSRASIQIQHSEFRAHSWQYAPSSQGKEGLACVYQPPATAWVDRRKRHHIVLGRA